MFIYHYCKGFHRMTVAIHPLARQHHAQQQLISLIGRSFVIVYVKNLTHVSKIF